jgi:hypothetical protein
VDLVQLFAGLLLPWLVGISALLVLRSHRRSLMAPGEVAWLAGAGYLAGAIALTLWMRALSLAGVRFGVLQIALPLLVVSAAFACIAWRRFGQDLIAAPAAAARALVASPSLGGVWRVIWWIAIAWISLRFALLALEVASRPLYPWDAWIQWATKARVWYELGRIEPFARAEQWFAADGSVYFDASPEYPPTMPLLQVWSCLLLGRWDDSLMNWPWWHIGVGLTLLVYGSLRQLELDARSALAGALIVASLPLANVHVALAGYADLPMAAYYTCAALALLRWSVSRDARDAGLSLLMAIACTQIKNPGVAWALTLLPGAAIALSPRHSPKIIGISFAAILLALGVLMQTQPTFFNYRLHLDFDLAWRALAESYFVYGNWNLLWYGALVAAILARQRLLAPPLAALTAIVGAGLFFLFVVFGFTDARAWVTDQTTVNRATLHLAPLIAVFTVLAFRAFAAQWAEARSGRASFAS